MQDAEPKLELYNPASHTLHVEEDEAPRVDEYEPRGHMVQEEDPSEEP